MKKWLISIGVLVGLLVVLPYILPWFVPGSRINCEHQQINIKTGQVRYTQYYWYLPVKQVTADTTLSYMLDGEMVDVADVTAWKSVNTFSPGRRVSPHYAFHSALAQEERVKMVFSVADGLSKDRKKAFCREVLAAWQLEDADHGADEVIQEFVEEVL